MRVASGLDRVASGDVRLRGMRVGLLAHPASVDARLRHARWIVAEAGAEVARIFGPEHGYGGEAQDMIGVGDARDPEGVPVVSLYGHTKESLSPTRDQLQGLDALVVDLQDVGSRYYTFVWTCALALIAAARAGVRTIVLDRPNPLGLTRVEGAPQRPGHRSFVGLYDVAVRHGLTIGEIATMVRELEGLDEAALEVIAVRGLTRATRFHETGLPWVLPSPNMPTLETALVYPGGCLIEGTALSEGRGTTRPFEIWGAPGLDGNALARTPIDGAILRPLRFLPMFQKHAGKICGGVQVHVVDADRFSPYAAYARMLFEAKRIMQSQFEWRAQAYEFVDDVPAIDLLSGGPELREAIDRGQGLDAVLADEQAGAARFTRERERWMLYR